VGVFFHNKAAVGSAFVRATVLLNKAGTALRRNLSHVTPHDTRGKNGWPASVSPGSNLLFETQNRDIITLCVASALTNKIDYASLFRAKMWLVFFASNADSDVAKFYAEKIQLLFSFEFSPQLQSTTKFRDSIALFLFRSHRPISNSTSTLS
jgi:hypothetical protein